MRQALGQQGVPSWFLEKAFSTPAKDMWYPSQEQLLAAHIITRVVDPNQFAISGLENIEIDQLEISISSIPVYRVLKLSDPLTYDKIIQKFSADIKAGRSSLEVQNSVGAITQSEIIPKYIRIAPDRELKKYWETQIQEAEYLFRSDPQLCTQFLFPDRRGPAFDLTRLVPKDILQSDLNALADLIREGARNPVGYTTEAPTKELEFIMQRVSARIPNATEILTEQKKFIDQPTALCGAIITLYREILSLPEQQSARLLRFMFSQ
jgi:hypothetical protein